MAINVSQAFHRTSANPVDESLALTKAQMLTVNDNLMPSKYLTVCQDDGKIYLYDKTNEPDVATGKFREFEGGGEITIDSTPTEGSTNAVQSGGTYTALANKVDKVSGKGLSTNDYTTAEKDKLAGINLSNYIPTSQKGVSNGVATLGANGKVPMSQIPNGLDETIFGYRNPVDELFYEDAEFTEPITPEAGIFYYDELSTNFYRWTGTAYVSFTDGSTGLVLGEVTGTAYDGGKGKENRDAITAIKDGQSIDSFGDVETALSNKVDKVSGKGLSTNDYDNTEKTKVTNAQPKTLATAKTIEGASVTTVEGVADAVQTHTDRLVTDANGVHGFKVTTSGGQDKIYYKSGNNWEEIELGSSIQVSELPAASQDNVGSLLQYIGNTTSVAPIYKHGYFYECVEDGGNYSWQNVPLMDVQEIQKVVLPTASADELGNIYQYVGATTQDYTNGYFYKCVLEDGTYKWVESKTQETIAEQMIGATISADGKSGSAPKPYIADRNRALFGDGKYHDIYTSASGSTVLVTAESSAFDGSTVTITDGVNSLTATMTDGVATFTDVQFYGTVNASVTNSQDITALGSTSMQAFGMYIIPVSADYSIINLTTEDVELRGQTVDVYLNGIQKGGATFNVLGQASITVVETGIYEIKSKVGSRFAKTTVDVAEMHQTYTSTLKLTTLFAVHYSEFDSDGNSCDYPQGYSNSDWDDYFYVDLTTGTPHYGDWSNDLAKFLFPKSCMLKYDGTVDYYLDENDESKKTDGTASDYNNFSYGGNAMMEWGQDGKRIYWTIIPDSAGDGWTFVVGDGDYDGLLHPWNHYDANNNLIWHFYTPKYHGTVNNGKLRSIAGSQASSGNTRQTDVTYARANGNGYDTEVYADWFLISMLLVLMSKSLKTQVKYGRGYCDYTWNNYNDSKVAGGMYDKGQFYGTSEGGTSGLGVKVFGMEHPWGNMWRGVRGLMNVENNWKVKLTRGNIDGTSVSDYNFDGSGYEQVGSVSGTSGGYISKMNITSKGLVPKVVSGSETTYYEDGCWFASGTMYARVGGSWYLGSHGGGFCVNGTSTPSYTVAHVGAALSCKPLSEEP